MSIAHMHVFNLECICCFKVVLRWRCNIYSFMWFFNSLVQKCFYQGCGSGFGFCCQCRIWIWILTRFFNIVESQYRVKWIRMVGSLCSSNVLLPSIFIYHEYNGLDIKGFHYNLTKSFSIILRNLRTSLYIVFFFCLYLYSNLSI